MKPSRGAHNLKYEYFSYYRSPFFTKIEPDNSERGYLLNPISGDFDERSDLINEVMFATTEDIHVRSRDDFIVNTEEFRAHYLRGDGPIFALYETITGIYEQREAENRRFSDQERALIRTLRHRTFQMWTEEFERKAAGEAPTFEYNSIIS